MPSAEDLVPSLLDALGDSVELSLVLRSLRNLTVTPAQQLAVVEAAGVVPLVALLDSEDEMVVSRAAATIANISAHPDNVASIAAAGAIPALTVNLKAGLDSSVLEHASKALRNLAVNPENERATFAAGAVPLLVKLLECEYPKVQEQAAAALGNLAAEEAIGPLVSLLSKATGPGHSPGVQEEAAAALGNLATIHADRVVALGGIESLVRLLSIGIFAGAQLEAALALEAIAACSSEHSAAIVTAGGIPPLLALLDGASNQEVVEGALEALLALAHTPANHETMAAAWALSPLAALQVRVLSPSALHAF